MGVCSVRQVQCVATQLVEDLARLFGRVETDRPALPRREQPQGGAGQVGAQGKKHPGGPQRVTAEEGKKPRGAGAQEGVVRGCRRRHPQRGEVLERPVEPPCEAPVVGLDIQVPRLLAASGPKVAGDDGRRIVDVARPRETDATTGREVQVPHGLDRVITDLEPGTCRGDADQEAAVAGPERSPVGEPGSHRVARQP